jgi:hypothetical protein
MTERREVEDLDLSGARVRGVNFYGAHITGAWLANASIEGEFTGLRMNGVLVEPLIEAELDRLHPVLPSLRATTADGLRSAFETVYGLWDALVERASALEETLLHVRVDEEWSFTETVRHLIYATDCWFTRCVLDDPHPFHSIDVSHREAHGQDPGIDLAAAPSFAEALVVRRERQARVREFLSALTDTDLDRVCEPTTKGNPPEKPQVGEALRVILNEEFWHSTFAERDLNTLTGV